VGGHAPADWAYLCLKSAAYLPHGVPLQFVFRALTPPGRPRRFDAQVSFWSCRRIATDLDNFDERLTHELSHLQWVALSDAANSMMPFHHRVVLAK